MQAKDLLLILFLPFMAIGFVVGNVLKAFLVGVELADKFTKWGGMR